MGVAKSFGLATIKTSEERRGILPPALWSTVLKECHDSVWAGPLRAPHTYASGDVGDRWALDVAGPLPTTDDGERYVITAVEYVTRYTVAVTVMRHTSENVTAFLMRNIVLNFGAFRDLLTDGAAELAGKAIEQLVVMLQAQPTNPVPYRPQMVGLVERFHRTWKDCIATYMNDELQRDWDVWVDFAVYAYNSGQHSTVMLSPNYLMMGRWLKSTNYLLRRASVAEVGKRTSYRRRLLAAMTSSRECAEAARKREHERQARGGSCPRSSWSATYETSETISARESEDGRKEEVVVELRRRRRRNAAEQYVLEFEVRPVRLRMERDEERCADDGRRCISIQEYDRLFYSGRVVVIVGTLQTTYLQQTMVEDVVVDDVVVVDTSSVHTMVTVRTTMATCGRLSPKHGATMMAMMGGTEESSAPAMRMRGHVGVDMRAKSCTRRPAQTCWAMICVDLTSGLSGERTAEPHHYQIGRLEH
ncbi:unnamed protein product [Phytophthora fragariaefolia]|uniref:Unnamed protein product n=1 Tax=Phytophthora fragariaefolia TaxID=1490495 RepID=A0A9W6XJZ5_9STRA|nr:unnamed protein product [Phytophthora fragariaefolia]